MAVSDTGMRWEYARRRRAHPAPAHPGEEAMKRTILSAAFVGALGLAMALPALAAEPPVLRVIVVQVSDVTAYTHEVEVIRALYKKLNMPITIDAYRATYAAAETNTIVVAIELPNLATLAKMNEMTRSQPEVVAEMKKINALRKITSDSLYEKLTP
jgi:spermidine/putrescine-binding protein